MSTDHEYPIPPFFRLLIIDDQIAASAQRREFFRNVFTAMVLEVTGNPFQFANIDIVFEGNPAKGFKKWQDEPFDLTLIDADFSTNRSSIAKHPDDLSKYVLNSRDQGLHIFTLMKARVNPAGLFTFRETMCRFFLWTALPWDKDEKGRPGLNTLLPQFGIAAENVIHKVDGTLAQFYEILTPIVEQIKEGNYSPEQSTERLLFALRKDCDGICRDIAGGCLINDQEQRYPFLPVLGRYEIGNNERLRLCGAHVPEALLDSKNKTRYLPLHHNSGLTRVTDVIAFLLEGAELQPVAQYCNALHARHESVQEQQEKTSWLPWYPGGRAGRTREDRGRPAFIAAATPLTGVSVVGGTDAIVALADKIEALLRGPFDKAILKTTYLDRVDQWENAWWPSVQIQSHMRSRCLYPDTGSPTLWNSGKTSMETLPPRQMNELLRSLLERGADTNRIVVSLGSKFPRGAGMGRIFPEMVPVSLSILWQRLFEDIFKDLPYDAFPYVEVNVRHFLREIVRYHLGGDEYLTPRTLNEKSSQDPEKYWQEFKRWLDVIHQVGVAFKKKMILKLPYRSDALAYAECIVSLREHHLITCHDSENAEFGVRGITVVNALKTPVPRSQKQKIEIPYTPAWYADPNSWKDARGKLHQMSGRFVGPYRNQILAGLLAGLPTLRDFGLEVWISGGLTSQNEVFHCLALEETTKEQKRVISGIQIGTWALLSTELKKGGAKNWGDRKSPEGPAEPMGRYQLIVKECLKKCCDAIHEACPHDALETKTKGSVVVVKDNEKCLACTSWACVAACSSKRLFRQLIDDGKERTEGYFPRDGEKAFLPRFSFLNTARCQACGRCSQTFYCDSFIDRVNTNLPPLMDSRYCSGCGLCAQVCSSGALQLYPPENFLVLLSSSRERKETLDMLKIPHLQYRPDKDLGKFPTWIREQLPLQRDTVKAFWNKRTRKDKFMLHQDEPTLYLEKREKRKTQCVLSAQKLLEVADQPGLPPHGREAVKRAAQWSQLIWSDPGQVLWDSFLLSIQSVIQTEAGEDVPRKVMPVAMQQGTFTISTWVVLLRQGQILLNQEMQSIPFKLNRDSETIAKYVASGFGHNRAAGLDVRACGSGLVSHADDDCLVPDDKLELAGLPWEKIKAAMFALPDEEYEQHKEMFSRLCCAVI